MRLRCFVQVVKAATPASGKLRMITMAEVERHATKESVWFVRGGKVGTLPHHCLCVLEPGT